ncbi:hypothetical protein [Glycomyces xiaoerkulensis]|uniref:hypothetical protein n=1 Tax=Glycomyces xiaoerkulensis TaxID=2038139 RepID=UPI000C265F3E|nr:hypothetical protein [Glycomyces xiaoerkulensis]
MFIKEAPGTALRAVVFALVLVPASAVAHTWGGGGAPSAAALLLGAGIAVLVHRFAVRPGGGSSRLLAAVALAQGCMHLVFSYGDAVHSAQMEHRPVPMALLHLAAAGAAALWAARIEPALPHLADRLWPRVGAAPAFEAAPPRPPTPTGLARRRLPQALIGPIGAVGRRGPPRWPQTHSR